MEWLHQAAGYIRDGLTVFSAITVVTGLIVAGSKIWNGIKCILRSEMLHTYYKNVDTGTIRQYELENFLMLYKAYKAMKGNTFIDEIHEEVTSWKIKS